MFSTIVNGIGSLIGAVGQNANITKQIRAQQEENQKNREYNMMLAQQQNAWNVEQWERENEYNSPVNQMSRLKAAGINPNLAYSNGVSNLAAASPEMTSGAPSSPVDMSALGQRATLGQAIQMALTNETARANIDNVKANTRKTLADAGISETEAKYLDAEKQLGIKINERVYEKLGHEIDKTFEEARAAAYNVENLNYEVMNKRIEQLYKEREMESIIKRLENEAKISEQDAKLSIESYYYRFLGIKSEAELAKFNANLPSQLENMFGENAGYAALVLQGVQYLLGNTNNFATLAGKNTPIKNTTNNVYVSQRK